MSKTFYISTSIPYVNAAPHIGHALEFIQADVLARFKRQRRADVFFLSGTDDNALKNVISAEAAGKNPKEWVDAHAVIFKDLISRLNCSINDFIRTSTDERHIAGAKKLWTSCKKEDIYKKKYKGLYCLGCEEFKSEKDLQNGECPEHPGKKLEVIEEKNYFFKLSNYQDKIQKLIESGELKIVPESRKNEILNFVKSGLEDFSISRSKSRAKGWGVTVPSDDSQIMYVWFDALSNYINALGYATGDENFKKYWVNGDEVTHVIGKGINRFHTVYWPAMLMSAGISLPKTVFVHGYLTINGEKISKTAGNVIDPFAVIQKYGVDATRYYLLREISSYEDGDFSYEKFEERFNGDLANGLGNFAARVLTLANGLGEIKTDLVNDIEVEVADKILELRKLVEESIAEFKFHDALAHIWELIAFGDVYVNTKKPWDKSVGAEAKRLAILNSIIILDNVAAMVYPFMPETSEKITKAIEWKSDNAFHVSKIQTLFPRI